MKKLALVLVVLASGCTSQIRAKKLGGSATVSLPAGEKLVNATWRESNLWLLTRKAKSGEQVEQYQLRESSSFGLLEGIVTIQER